jgi:hypothetical protein
MYKIFIGNPYHIFEENDVICTTTNGEVRKNGYAVMGKGNAQFVRDTFKVDKLLGSYLNKFGNRVFLLGAYQYNKKSLILATFPTKNTWRDKSDVNLIKTSSIQIKEVADKFNLRKIYIPIPGCSNGQLKWSEVKQHLNILDERFIIYSLDAKDFN